MKVGLHKDNFSPAMHSWKVFHNNRRCSIQKKKEIFVKLVYSIKIKLIKFLVKVLRNRIKHVVSRVVSGELSGALKVALLRAMTIQSAF